MLVLTRRKGESIMIGDQIELIVVAVEGDIVKIGIKAPTNIEIFRKEIYRSIQLANREASENISDVGKIANMFKKKE